MKTISILSLIILVALTSFGQKGVTAELIGSYHFNSERHSSENGDPGIYGEIRLGYRLSRYFEINAFVGYQERGFIYYAQFDNPWKLVPLFMNRQYVPVGANGRLYLTDLFFEKLRLWKKAGRWDVYNQIGFAVLKGSDKNDERDDYFKNQGAYVPYYLVPYRVEYNNFYITYLAGIRYNFNPKLGIFIEGGDGALMNLQLGISARF